MSLIQQVATEVLLRGSGSADDIQIPGKTYQQVVRALQNAASRGLIESVQARSRGQHKGRAPNVYGPVRSRAPAVPGVASVWDLGRLGA